jgi:hypothetical protein
MRMVLNCKMTLNQTCRLRFAAPKAPSVVTLPTWVPRHGSRNFDKIYPDENGRSPTQNPKIAVGYKGRAHSRARVCLTGKAEGPTLRRHAGFSMELVSVGTASRRLIVESGACFFSVLLPVCRVNPAPTTMKIKSRISAIMESDFMYLSCNSKITTPPYGATMTNYF